MANPFQMLQGLQNPMGMIQQSLLEKMRASNPQKFEQGMAVVRGKSEEQHKEIAMNMARDRGITDVNQFARSFANQMGFTM